MKKIAYLMCLLLGFFIAGCADDAGTSSSDADSSSADYSVGSKVTYGTASYYVVNNSFDSGASKSALAARSAENGSNDDVLEMVKTVSVEKMKSYAEEYFGPNILLIRTAGKVIVPHGKRSEYSAAYKAVTENLDKNEKVSDYFDEEAMTVKTDSVWYRDIYLVLDENKEKLGLAEIAWKTEQYFDVNGESKSLSDLLMTFSSETAGIIRSSLPYNYKVRKYDSDLKRDFLVRDYNMKDGYLASLGKNAKDSLYVYTYTDGNGKEKKGINTASRISNAWNSNGIWTSSHISLSAVYNDITNTAGIRFYVHRNLSGKYYYQIEGTSLPKDGGRQYKSNKAYFKFNDDGTYTAGDFDVAADAKEKGCTLYSADATMEYDENALSIPVDFILNVDENGNESISFGPSVYEWVKTWRKYIVDTYGGSVYEE